MSAQSRIACGTCQHPGAFHILPIGACRRNGCPCDRFVDPARPPKDDDEDERTMLVRIPPGFYATVTLYPVQPPDEETPDAA